VAHAAAADCSELRAALHLRLIEAFALRRRNRPKRRLIRKNRVNGYADNQQQAEKENRPDESAHIVDRSQRLKSPRAPPAILQRSSPVEVPQA
jgi:hypothetical protein